MNSRELPILYSFRRCPYAIRARLALAHRGITVELREVLLRDKPKAMLAASAKGTVPVLLLPQGRVLDESLEVMRWALTQVPEGAWNPPSADQERFIAQNDGAFKYFLDRYKYADRYPTHPQDWYRDQAAPHLTALDQQLENSPFLCGDAPGFVDAALMPFLRQFAMVDPSWFAASPYTSLQRWLQDLLDSALFASVMLKFPPWHPDHEPLRMTWEESPESAPARGLLAIHQ